MSRQASVPTYRKHKQSGQAIVTVMDGAGRRRDVLLGRHGTAASREAYARVIAEWEANRRQIVPRRLSSLSVNELILAYWRHVEEYYRHADGTPTSEVATIKLALRHLKQLYGLNPATDFDSLSLKTVRENMILAGLCRNSINKDVARIKRMFKWAAAEKLCPDTVFQSLSMVDGLRAGRSAARETQPVGPVPLAFVEATLPFLSPVVAAMVQLQLSAGMRPGEVVVMRGLDLDTSGKVWSYRPGSDQGPHGAHKTAHRGKDRVIEIGPRGQEILRPWLRLKLDEYLFQPREAIAWRNAQWRAARKTPMTPSQRARRPKANPRKSPGERYTVSAYDNAIADGCIKADAAARKAALDAGQDPPAVLVPHWHPNQLRHSKATEIRREFGLDAARAVLGHSSPVVTEVYAEIDLSKAAEVALRLG